MESAGNTTVQILDASGSSFDTFHIFDGTPQDTTGYSNIITMISAEGSGRLNVRHSLDSSVWDIVDSYIYPTDVSLGQGMYNTTPVKALYCNVQFENTSISANSIRLQTILNTGGNGGILDADLVDVCINNQPIGVIVVNTEPINISGGVTVLNTESNPVPVTISGGSFNVEPITIVWETDQIGPFVEIVTAASSIVYNIHATNFAPDYRYLKLYNQAQFVTLDPAVTKPTLTLPLPPDIPQHISFGNKGLKFNNGLKARVTRLYRSEDQNMSAIGDTGLSIMLDED